MITKIKNWLVKTGITNVGYILGAIASIMLIGGKMGFFIGGGLTGLFVYFNYAVIKELIKGIE